MPNRDLIVIGGSAGGWQALQDLLSRLPAELPATVLALIHSGPEGAPSLVEALGSKCKLPVRYARDGERLERGTVLLAPPDRHLVIDAHRVRLVRGPRENMWRPAIDVLFRSAAVAYQSRVIGVLLSGYLDDGTVGLQAISRCGGLTIVQEPQEAGAAEMPRIALANATIDFVQPTGQIADTLVRAANESAPPAPPAPKTLQLEARIAATAYANAEMTNQLGDRTDYTCPECSGPIWRRADEPLSFRCAVGHAYAADPFLENSRGQLESSLWVAVRLLEQRASVVRELEARADGTRRSIYSERAAEASAHAQTLRKLLQTIGEQGNDPALQ